MLRIACLLLIDIFQCSMGIYFRFDFLGCILACLAPFKWSSPFKLCTGDFRVGGGVSIFVVGIGSNFYKCEETKFRGVNVPY